MILLLQDHEKVEIKIQVKKLFTYQEGIFWAQTFESFFELYFFLGLSSI